MSDESKQKQWQNTLEGKRKRVNKKDLKAMLAPRIVSGREIKRGKDKEWEVVGLNFLDSQITLINRKEEDCLQDLATLNGIAVE